MRDMGYTYQAWAATDPWVRGKLRCHAVERALREAWEAEQRSPMNDKPSGQDPIAAMHRAFGVA